MKFNPQPKPTPSGKKPKKPLKRSPIKKKRKKTGELDLFKEIYIERKGICEVTKKPIPFSIKSFAHILGKKAYPSFRLKKENIAMVKERIHDLYDNSSKEKLLEEFPGAIIIYEKKELLKQEYYSKKP